MPVMDLIMALVTEAKQVALRQRQPWRLPHRLDVVGRGCRYVQPLRFAHLTLAMLFPHNLRPKV
ncbi:hypothetical protein SDC9_203379 [bioreactor metagenome]|uniref:Uncharacterized protein n=1 Tax=bioreactor metagenome TaxID=1076179 RepID=A0A645IW99_9ZZZZ